jgi:hypothetical protein
VFWQDSNVYVLFFKIWYCANSILSLPYINYKPEQDVQKFYYSLLRFLLSDCISCVADTVVLHFFQTSRATNFSSSYAGIPLVMSVGYKYGDSAKRKDQSGLLLQWRIQTTTECKVLTDTRSSLTTAEPNPKACPH